MKRIFCIFLAILITICVICSCSPKEKNAFQEKKYSGTVMIYSSMQDGPLQAIKEAFEKKYPGITMDYYSASAGKVISKIAEEVKEGKINADVIWLGNPADYERFKGDGHLQKYISNEIENQIDGKYIDEDGFYAAARIVTPCIIWNKSSKYGLTPKTAPKNWNDLLDPKYKDKVVMTDPKKSSTTRYWVSCMMQNPKYGEEYFKKLKENGCKLEGGILDTFNKIVDGTYMVGICSDYGSSLVDESLFGYNYPETDAITLSTPIALVNNCNNMENGKYLIDFILSKEGQNILVSNNLVSARNDVQNSVDTKEIASRNMKVDLDDLAENASKYVDKFSKIFEG